MKRTIDIPDIPDPNPDPLVAPPQPVPEQVPNLPRRSNRPQKPTRRMVED